VFRPEQPNLPGSGMLGTTGNTLSQQEPTMTRRTVLNAIALAAAALAFGTPAEAGGGVRLTFGGPLPSFVATPTPGYGGGSGYSAPRKSAPKLHAAKRRQPAPVIVAERHKPKAPRHVVPVRHTPTSNAPKTIPAIPVTANEGENPGFIGRALAIDNLPRAETVHALLPSETIVAKDAPELAERATASVATASIIKTEAPTQQAATDTPATCRKFIPAVGVTVTVACD
jgi:hypothetical protein